MKKIKKQIVLLLVLCLFALCASGCRLFNSAYCSNPASDADVIAFFTQRVSSCTSDPFDVKIAYTETLKAPLPGIDGPSGYINVRNGRVFTVTITFTSPAGTYVSTETYRDSYTHNGSAVAANATEWYIDVIALHKIMNNYAYHLLSNNINDFVIVEDNNGIPGSQFGVFLYCEDYDSINNVLNQFKNEVDHERDISSCYISYGCYIFTDKTAFSSINTQKFGLKDNINLAYGGLTRGGDGIEMVTGKDATRIGGSHDGSFDKKLFETNGAAYAATDSEYRDYTSFDYVVFWAYGEPNLTGVCEVQLFGVK